MEVGRPITIRFDESKEWLLEPEDVDKEWLLVGF